MCDTLYTDPHDNFIFIESKKPQAVYLFVVENLKILCISNRSGFVDIRKNRNSFMSQIVDFH